MKYTFILILGLLLHHPIVVKAQQDAIGISDELDFLFYLLEHKQFDDADLYSNKLIADSVRFTSEFKDSVRFICASAWDKYKKPEKALALYDRIHDNSVFYYPASYRSALIEIERKNYTIGREKLENIYYDDKDYFTALKKFELSGIYLLMRDYAAFDSIQTGFQSSDSLLVAENNYMLQCSSLLRNQRKKSGLLAGGLSAVIPGLGKVYTGKPWEGLASFIKTIPLAAITYENYRVDGFKSPQFYIFGSLFALFYVGNIWGSSISAKIEYQETSDEIIHNIVVGLRIPVDKYFR